MSDIVERLRDWRNLHLARGGELFEAAADEIERLRNGAVDARETVRLTAEEREAIAYFAVIEGDNYLPAANTAAAMLRKMLERLA
jgi:hypothetical protein